MPDRLEALRLLLLDTPAVTAVVQTRVFTDELPDAVAARMPRAALVLLDAGSSQSVGGGLQDFSDQRVDIRHYGRTPAGARSLYLVVREVLRNLTRTRVGDTLLHWCRQSGGPNPMRESAVPWPGGIPDPTIHWPLTVASWQVMAADIPAPVPA